MSLCIHSHARTIRQESRDSGLSVREASTLFNFTGAMAAKWLKLDEVQDRLHRVHTLHTKLSATQEATLLSLRQSLCLLLDDLLLYVAR